MFDFVRRRDAADLDYIVEFSDDLGDTDPWTAATEPETVTPINDFWEKVSIADTKDPVNTDKRFGRVRFEYQP